jgi:hypothetical protein
MTTHSDPITADDIAGLTERGRTAYNQRRRWLRAEGLAVLPDLYSDDDPLPHEREIRAIADAGADHDYQPTGETQYWADHAAETAATVAQEREWSDEDAVRQRRFGTRN